MKKNERKMFRLVDKYEGFDLLLESDDINEITKYAREFDRDTDGECYLDVYELISSYQYVRKENWKY